MKNFLSDHATYDMRKCAVEIKDKGEYPDNVKGYRIYLRAMKAEELPDTVSASKPTFKKSSSS